MNTRHKYKANSHKISAKLIFLLLQLLLSKLFLRFFNMPEENLYTVINRFGLVQTKDGN